MWFLRRSKKPSPALSEESNECLQKLANDHGVVLLLFVSALVPIKSGSKEGTKPMINSVDEYNVGEALNQIDAKHRRGGRKAYLVVSSPGGDLDSSFKIALAVRKFFDDITVFVPRNAHSGGALLALAGNRIRMGRMSSLSPLDVQTEYGGKRVSANYIISAQANVCKYLRENRSEISPIDNAVMKLFDPVTLERARQTQKMGMRYVSRILKMAKCTDPTAVSSKMCTSFPVRVQVL